MLSDTNKRRQIIGLIPSNRTFSCRTDPVFIAACASVMRRSCKRHAKQPTTD